MYVSMAVMNSSPISVNTDMGRAAFSYLFGRYFIYLLVSEMVPKITVLELMQYFYMSGRFECGTKNESSLLKICNCIKF